jgi:superfamily II RNA helicase
MSSVKQSMSLLCETNIYDAMRKREEEEKSIQETYQHNNICKNPKKKERNSILHDPLRNIKQGMISRGNSL